MAGRAETPRTGGDDALLLSLLESCGRGNEGAMAVLFDRTACAALAVARCVAGDDDAADRATHDAYLEIWDRAAAGRFPHRDLALWVLGVVHRRAVATVAAGAA